MTDIWAVHEEDVCIHQSHGTSWVLQLEVTLPSARNGIAEHLYGAAFALRRAAVAHTSTTRKAEGVSALAALDPKHIGAVTCVAAIPRFHAPQLSELRLLQRKTS